VETDACTFQHPPEAEARSFIASDLRREGLDLRERQREASVGHALGMIMLIDGSPCRLSACLLAAVPQLTGRVLLCCQRLSGSIVERLMARRDTVKCSYRSAE